MWQRPVITLHAYLLLFWWTVSGSFPFSTSLHPAGAGPVLQPFQSCFNFRTLFAFPPQNHVITYRETSVPTVVCRWSLLPVRSIRFLLESKVSSHFPCELMHVCGSTGLMEPTCHSTLQVLVLPLVPALICVQIWRELFSVLLQLW